MAAKNSKKSARNKFFVALWLLLFLVLVIVFLVKKDDFVANLKEANFFERVTGSTPDFIQNFETKEKKNETNGLLDVEVENSPGKAEVRDAGTFDLEDLKQNAKDFSSKNEVALPPPQKGEIFEEEKVFEETEPKKEEPVQMMNAKLFFVQVASDGNVSRKSIVRQIPKSESPLTNTLKALLQGPQAEENCMSLIPEGTRLLGASVRDGIAVLNFSEEFEFNPIGAEGYRAQLMQFVFTATEFATVESVQFLIEGKHKDYIGSGEDIWMWIGSPYARSSFK